VNRLPAFVLGCAALVAAVLANARPALAENGGISGYVVDAASGRRIPGQLLVVYRYPFGAVAGELRTDAHGFFSDITLAPGRYAVAVASGEVTGLRTASGCAVDDVFGGEVTRIRISLGREGAPCSGPRPNPSLIDANATADVYRI
jgi:hypothetical protein